MPMSSGRLVHHRRRKRHFGGGPLKRNFKGFTPSVYRPAVSLCPDRMFVKLKFSETQTVPQGVAASDYAYRGNCHLDCNFTSAGVGQHAYGGPQWHAFYNRCYVTASKINLRVITSDPVFCEVALYPANTAFVATNMNNAASRARKRSVIISDNGESRSMTQYCSTKALLGTNRNSNMEYSADPTAPIQTPFSDWFWHITSILQTGTSGNLTFLVDIEYNIVFFDRRPILGTVTSSSSG